MQDRPRYDELLAAIERFLDEEIVPNVPGSRGFHARVSANAIRIIRRELEFEDEQLATEWDGLDAILGVGETPQTRVELREALLARNAALCALIRSGNADSGAPYDAIFGHVRRTVADKLRVTNPGWLT